METNPCKSACAEVDCDPFNPILMRSSVGSVFNPILMRSSDDPGFKPIMMKSSVSSAFKPILIQSSDGPVFKSILMKKRSAGSVINGLASKRANAIEVGIVSSVGDAYDDDDDDDDRYKAEFGKRP